MDTISGPKLGVCFYSVVELFLRRGDGVAYSADNGRLWTFRHCGMTRNTRWASVGQWSLGNGGEPAKIVGLIYLNQATLAIFIKETSAFQHHD